MHEAAGLEVSPLPSIDVRRFDESNPAPHQHGTHPDVARLLAALILRLHRNGNIHLDTASFVADESFVHIGMTLTGFVQTAIS